MKIRINTNDVVHESLDGEVVIVNLKTGSYFSLSDSATEIWGALETCESDRDVLAHLGQRFRGDSARLREELATFIEALAAEGLVVLEGALAMEPVPARAAEDAPLFRSPVLAKHTDMEGLLQLDPVHDVSEQGWPERKPA
jgi:hypothetical protein